MSDTESPISNNCVRAFAKQTLRSGTIKGAAFGCLRPGSPDSLTDLILAHETSLDLYATGSELTHICSAPVFGNVLDICRISQPSSPSEQNVCAVLAESGQLCLVYLEEYDSDQLRFRLLDQIHARSTRGMDPGPYSMLRKIAPDPLSRALAIVSWTSTLELVQFSWSSSRKLLPVLVHVDGVICDAAILAPSLSEAQRILMVAAVVDSASDTFSLQLFESWAHVDSTVPLVQMVAKLPMPRDMTVPLHIIVLPALPECFLLVTEKEVVFISAVQILSGDVHLHRMPLPAMDDGGGGADLVAAYCTVECNPSVMDTAGEQLGFRHSSTTSATRASQRVIVGMQSGAVMRVDVSDLPAIKFTKILDLSNSGPKLAIGNCMAHLGSGSVFVAGDCTDHAIIQISTFETAIPTMTVMPVLANQSPMLDIAIDSDSHLAYWTSGRTHTGSIHEARFGCTIECLYTMDIGHSEEEGAISHIWRLNMDDSSQCIIMKTVGSCIAACIDGDGNWSMHAELQQWVSSIDPVFVGNAGSQIVCVSKGSLDILDSLQPKCIASAGGQEVFTHGASTVLEDKSVAAVVVRLTLSGSNASWSRFYQSAIRMFDICRQEQVCEEMLGYEVSVLRILHIGSQQYIAVGTYKPQVIVYRIHGQGNLERVLDWDLRSNGINHTETGAGFPDQHHLPQVVNDVSVLCTSTQTCLLVGLRNGSLIKLPVDASSAGPFVLGEALEDQVGGAPVTFTYILEPLSTPSISASKVVVLSGSLHTAELNGHGSMRVVPCVSSNSKLPTFHHLLPLSSTDTCFIGVSDGNVISTLAIDLSSQCHIRTLPVGDEPRRILADRDTGLLVVAGVQWQAQDSSSFPTSSLKVLDPRDGTVHAESRLQKNEVVYALTHWHVHGRKPYCFVCVGTGMYSAAGVPTPDSTKGGRIVIYSLKTLKRRRPGAKASPISSAASSPRLVPQPDTSSSYELKFRWESARNGPVTALAQLGDSYLVVGAGMSCIVLQLDMERGRLIECCEVMLRFPVTSVHVNGYQIAVGSQRESVHLFEFTPGDTRDALEMTSSARFGLQTADARFLSDRLVVGADRSGFLFAMPNGSDNSDEFAVDYKMGFHLGSVCTRVLSGRLVTYLHRSEHIVPWRADTSKRSDVVLASTVTGTLWSVVRITGQAFDLLQLLQEAVLALHYMHPAFPLLAGSRSICRVTRPAHNLKHQNVVDGELSTMFLDTLTEDEQRQVVASSTELRSKALLMCDASPLPDELSQNAAAVRAICTLIQGLNRACIY